MRRVVPSQVVRFVDARCSEFLEPPTPVNVPGDRRFPFPTPGLGHFVTPTQLRAIRVLNKLLAAVPDELLPSSDAAFHLYLTCASQVRFTASADRYDAFWATEDGE